MLQRWPDGCLTCVVPTKTNIWGFLQILRTIQSIFIARKRVRQQRSTRAAQVSGEPKQDAHPRGTGRRQPSKQSGHPTPPVRPAHHARLMYRLCLLSLAIFSSGQDEQYDGCHDHERAAQETHIAGTEDREILIAALEEKLEGYCRCVH